MLIRADPGTGTISLLSFPRDLVVPIYCPKSAAPLRSDRINAAYAQCGPAGTLDTVKHLTKLPVNYLIWVNFHGFKEIVDKIGGIWMDVDRRYFNVNTGTAATNYANINLQPGYQRLTGEQALAFVRFRHTDDDYHRLARQQQFVRALKQQFAHNFNPLNLPSIVKTITSNVDVGGKVDDRTVLRDALFASRLKGGHFFQDRIEGITGYSETHASASLSRMRRRVHPSRRQQPQAADAAALGRKLKSKSTAPAEGHERDGVERQRRRRSAARASYLLAQRGYKIVLPPTGKPQNAPTFQYFRTTVYYDAAQRRAKAAAAALANLFGDADVKPLPPNFTTLANGAIATVVVGQNFHGTIAPVPVDKTPVRQPALVTPNAAMTRSLLMQVRKRVRFRLQVPRLVESSSRLEFDAPIRVYNISKGHRAVRLTFRIGSNEYWGIEETNWNDAPALAQPSFIHKIRGREYALYYSGAHLHMVVLRKDGATYWVVNSVLDELSNETMLAIARGLAPLPK